MPCLNDWNFCLRIELNQHFSLYLLKWFSYAHHTPPKRKISMVRSCCAIVFDQQKPDRVKLACYSFNGTFATQPNVRYQFTYSFCSCFICLSDLHPFRLIGRRHKQIPNRMRIESEPKQTILRHFVFLALNFALIHYCDSHGFPSFPPLYRTLLLVTHFHFYVSLLFLKRKKVDADEAFSSNFQLMASIEYVRNSIFIFLIKHTFIVYSDFESKCLTQSPGKTAQMLEYSLLRKCGGNSIPFRVC